MTNYSPYIALSATNLASEESTTLETESSEIETNETTEAAGEGLFFQPDRFIGSLQYMGKGMLGILIVMGAIIIATTILNAVSSRKKKKNESEDEE